MKQGQNSSAALHGLETHTLAPQKKREEALVLPSLRTSTKPRRPFRSWSPGSTGATFTSSVKDPKPISTEVTDKLRKAAAFPPRRYRTHALPGPCHLGRLTHGSPRRGDYFFSGRVAPPLDNQSLPGVDYPTT